MSHLSLFEQVLGANFDRLPIAVQGFHRLRGHQVLTGWVETQAPWSTLARCIAACMGAPTRASAGPLRFELTSATEGETWTRHFPARVMTSRLRLVAGELNEKIGPVRLAFRLSAHEDRLNMELTGMRLFGLPCPSGLRPRVIAEESGNGEKLHFEVLASLPYVGVIARYRGHLNLPPQAPS